MAAKQKCFQTRKKYVWNWLLRKKQTMIFHFLCDKDEAGFEKEMIFPCSKLDLSSMFGVTGKMDLELFHFLSLSLSHTHFFARTHTHASISSYTHPSLFIHTFMHTHTIQTLSYKNETKFPCQVMLSFRQVRDEQILRGKNFVLKKFEGPAFVFVLST